MIQRIQSLYLLFVAIITAVCTFTTLVNFQIGTETFVNFHLFGLTGIEFTQDKYIFYLLTIGASAIFVLSIATILMYKNRPLQYRLCAIILLLNVFLIGGSFFAADHFSAMLHADSMEYTVSAYLMLVNLLLLSFTQRAIKKDESLVRSLDRLR